MADARCLLNPQLAAVCEQVQGLQAEPAPAGDVLPVLCVSEGHLRHVRPQDPVAGPCSIAQNCSLAIIANYLCWKCLHASVLL